jgi:hypothetical protein
MLKLLWRALGPVSGPGDEVTGQLEEASWRLLGVGGTNRQDIIAVAPS